MKPVGSNHDLRLPEWGPYGKRYIGISHITDERRGVRFDLSVFPGYYRRSVAVPNVLWESRYHPWEAAGDLSYYSHRHELEWKDQVFVDVSFSKISDAARLIRCACVNRTQSPQSLLLNYVGSLHYPTLNVFPNPQKLDMTEVDLPPGAVWVDAADHVELRFAHPRPGDSLVTDALRRGEIRAGGFTGGSGIGQGFGQDRGDRILFRFVVPGRMQDAVAVFRYRAAQAISFDLSGARQEAVEFKAGEDFSLMTAPLGTLSSGEAILEMVSQGGGAMELDGFAVVEASEVSKVTFRPARQNVVPQLCDGPLNNGIILKYEGIETHYGVAWLFEPFEVREYVCDELVTLMQRAVHAHGHKVMKGSGDGHFTNVFLRPITLKPQSEMNVDGLVCRGTRDEVAAAIRHFSSHPQEIEPIFRAARSSVADLASNPEGERYIFSQGRMAATTLTGVTYPIYFKRRYSRATCPGRWWDCLYTWDAGFLGLGLLELDVDRAVDTLNAYLTAEGDTETAYIHHGSPVPVQVYLFLELWNRTQLRELLAQFYPRVRQFHRFLAGRLGSSDTRRLKSKLLNTWHYFYNSGGWDDYPPQWFAFQNNLYERMAPMINTSHAIRTAKILSMAAGALGLSQDVDEYARQDIEPLSAAIQQYAWDEQEGYFGYVRHTEGGEPEGIFRHESGRNFNMGLDGAYPLLAGICDATQTRRLMSHLTTPGRLWSPIGLSAVDQSAPYYRHDGYWNGTVWMPHQWFFWKTLLDLGELQAARSIAQTALDVWKREVELSYHCFEHFIIETGRGAGWHAFGGLSCPVLSWFGAYYRPGRLTGGFDVWIEAKEFRDDCRSLSARLKVYGPREGTAGLMVTMNPTKKYRVRWRGNDVSGTEFSPGTLGIEIPRDAREGDLIVEAR